MTVNGFDLNPVCSVSWAQSHYIEVAQGDIFMEQKMRFGLVLGRLATLKKVVLDRKCEEIFVFTQCSQNWLF